MRQGRGHGVHAALGDAEILGFVEAPHPHDVRDAEHAARSARIAHILRLDEKRLHPVVFEIQVEQVADADRQHGFPHLLVGGAAHVCGHLRKGGWLGEDIAVQNAGGAFPKSVPRREGPGVALGQAPDAVVRLAVVVPGHQIRAVREGLEGHRVVPIGGVAVAGQVQLLNHFALEQVADVGAIRHREAGMDHVANDGAAGAVEPFQHQHGQPFLGQVAGAYQTVVPGANDDGVILGSFHLLLSSSV